MERLPRPNLAEVAPKRHIGHLSGKDALPSCSGRLKI